MGGAVAPRLPLGYATGGAQSQTRKEIEFGQRRECNFGSFPKLSPAIENERYGRGTFTAYSRLGADEDSLFYFIGLYLKHQRKLGSQPVKTFIFVFTCFLLLCEIPPFWPYNFSIFSNFVFL